MELHGVVETNTRYGVKREHGRLLLGGCRFRRLQDLLSVIHHAVQQEQAFADLVMTADEFLVAVVAEAQSAALLLQGCG